MHLAIIKGSSAEAVLAELREYSNRPENIFDLTQNRTQEKLSGVLDGKEHTRVVKIPDPTGFEVQYAICFTIDRIRALSQDASNPTIPMKEIQVDLRHLSVTTPDSLPTPTAMVAIAYFFGFRGPPQDWTFNLHPDDDTCMAAVQVMNEEEVGAHKIIMMPPPRAQEART